jgi:signal transduction histidine kinase/CheY-like chemotaxis protein
MCNIPDISKAVLDKPLTRYALAAVTIAASFLLRYALVQGLGLEMPLFITFYPAVILVAILAGFWPGLLATALIVVGTDYLILAPVGHFAIARTSDVVALVFFAAMGVFMSLVAEHDRRGQRLIADYKADHARRESEVLYRNLFNAMDEGFCVIEVLFDPENRPTDFRFLEVNAAYERQTGIPNPVGKRMREIAPALEEYWFEFYGRVALTGEPAHLINEAKAINGYYDVWAYRVGQPDQRRVAVVFSEISERRRAEEHIQQLNRVYSVLSDINQTIVREKDSQTMLEAACRIAVEKGKFLMAWVGMADPVTHSLKPIASSGAVGDYLDRVRLDLLDPARSTGPSARCFYSGEHAVCNDIEHELYRPWRSYALEHGYRSLAAFPLRCEGQIVGVFSLYASELAFFDDEETKLLDEMAMDMSFALEVNRREEDRRKKEEELRWRTAFFEAQVDSSIDGVLVVDSHGKKILHNQRLNDMLKIPTNISDDDDYAHQFQFVSTLIKNPDQYREKINYLNSHPDEISRDEVELTDGTILDRYSSPVRDKALNYYGRIWTFHDITERRQLEEKFRQSQKMDAIGQLTGGIAHDFNNLLTVILGCSEVIGDEVKENPRLRKMADMILGAAQRGADLTHRMLAFGRRQALQPRSVNVNQLILNLEGMLRHTLREAIELDVSRSGESLDALVDPAELESALLNLCINAQDAMPDGGKLLIETGYAFLDSNYAAQNADVRPGQYILVSVSDTGTGISPEIMDRVFEPFFTTKEVGKGTGLGLSMVYGFAKQSQGHVKIYSEVGFGTSVKLYLPKADRTGDQVEQVQSSVTDLRGVEFILLVEDDDLVRDFALAQLTDLGYRVLEAANGNDALKILQEHKDIDLLFTDVVMPGGMNGYELAQEACRLRPMLNVLYTSGYVENAIMHRGMLDKDVQLLSKPYSRMELATKIRQALLQSSSTVGEQGRNAK